MDSARPEPGIEQLLGIDMNPDVKAINHFELEEVFSDARDYLTAQTHRMKEIYVRLKEINQQLESADWRTPVSALQNEFVAKVAEFEVLHASQVVWQAEHDEALREFHDRSSNRMAAWLAEPKLPDFPEYEALLNYLMDDPEDAGGRIETLAEIQAALPDVDASRCVARLFALAILMPNEDAFEVDYEFQSNYWGGTLMCALACSLCPEFPEVEDFEEAGQSGRDTAMAAIRAAFAT